MIFLFVFFSLKRYIAPLLVLLLYANANSQLKWLSSLINNEIKLGNCLCFTEQKGTRVCQSVKPAGISFILLLDFLRRNMKVKIRVQV